MTVTFDPAHPEYLDQLDVRGELTRIFDVCQGCRRCVGSCGLFPTLFDLLDGHEVPDAGRLTPADQDQVVDACVQCRLCVAECPYAPGRHELSIDVPRTMVRAAAMRRSAGLLPWRTRAAAQLLGRTDLIGRLATTTGFANAFVTAEPRSVRRRVLALFTGVSATRRLSPFARQRFSTWMANWTAKRPAAPAARRRGRVTVFPSCLVEYQATSVGTDLVQVYERNGVECGVTAARCCGAPWLHAGDVERFGRLARRNVAVLAAEVRAGTDIVVPEPACLAVIRNDYPDHVGGDDARLVADHTFDAAAYLARLHEEVPLDADFPGDTPRHVTYHLSNDLRALGVGVPGRTLLELTGARVTTVDQRGAIGGLWSLRAANDAASLPLVEQPGEPTDAAADDVVAGDGHLVNTLIAEQTTRRSSHPLQILARAYGIAER
ncbi:MAG TPA: heterodisulfide reductase-related iron-sulfur binding cluster [Ilumatobacteraceae bacterium]|nr:heterodisulfide reductase-related iron-sulfur binding cluster [Ilumatobacteraceae bacterium]